MPNKFTQTKYGKGLKEFILENYTIQRLVDFGDLKVFGNVTTYPSIMVIRKAIQKLRNQGTYLLWKAVGNLNLRRLNDSKRAIRDALSLLI